MPLIDAYTIIGPWPLVEADLTIATLQAEMRKRNVVGSLVTHAGAIFYDQQAGNDLAVEACRGQQGLVPVAVLNPLRYPNCLAEAERRLAQGVKVFRLCPREHHYPLCGSVGPLRELLRSLEAARLILVDLHGIPQPVVGAELEDLLPAPTALSVDADALGCVLHAAKRGQHVYLETSYLHAGDALELAVSQMGGNRVIFGSGSPLRSVGSAVMSTQFAELSDEVREAILGGNVQRLLS